MDDRAENDIGTGGSHVYINKYVCIDVHIHVYIYMYNLQNPATHELQSSARQASEELQKARKVLDDS